LIGDVIDELILTEQENGKKKERIGKTPEMICVIISGVFLGINGIFIGNRSGIVSKVWGV